MDYYNSIPSFATDYSNLPSLAMPSLPFPGNPVSNIQGYAPASFIPNFGQPVTMQPNLPLTTPPALNLMPSLAPVTSSAPAPAPALRAVRMSTIHSDGYSWHIKSSQKLADNTITARYYVCACRGCGARKNVKLDAGGRIFDVRYRGEHNHEPPVIEEQMPHPEVGAARPYPTPTPPATNAFDLTAPLPGPAPGPGEAQAPVAAAVSAAAAAAGALTAHLTHPLSNGLPLTAPGPSALHTLLVSMGHFTRYLGVHPAAEALFATDEGLALLRKYGRSGIAIDSTARFAANAPLEVAVVLVGAGAAPTPYSTTALPDNDVDVPSVVMPVAFMVTSRLSCSYNRLALALAVVAGRPSVVASDPASPWSAALQRAFPQAHHTTTWPFIAHRLHHWLLQAVAGRVAEIEAGLPPATPSQLRAEHPQCSCTSIDCGDFGGESGGDSEDGASVGAGAVAQALDGQDFDDVEARLLRAIHTNAGRTSVAHAQAVRAAVQELPAGVRDRVQVMVESCGAGVTDWNNSLAEHALGSILALYSPRTRALAGTVGRWAAAFPAPGNLLVPTANLLAGEAAAGARVAERLVEAAGDVQAIHPGSSMMLEIVPPEGALTRPDTHTELPAGLRGLVAPTARGAGAAPRQVEGLHGREVSSPDASSFSDM